MTARHLNRILCAADPRGSADAVASLVGIAASEDADAIAITGDLAQDRDSYRVLFRELATAKCPVFWVPGAADAPVDRYLREAYNVEVAFPLLHGVHGTAAYASGEVVFAGLGGEVSDDPAEHREEHERLRYPRWEPEYRLKLIGQLDYNELVLLFWSPPAHKGRGSAGSEVLAELIGTYRPRLVVFGGERGVEMLGRSISVAPGSLADGYYAVAQLREGTAKLERFSV